MFIIRALLPAFAGTASHDVDLLAAERTGVLARLFERLARQRPIAEWAGEGKGIGNSQNERGYKGAPEEHKIAHIPNREGQQFKQKSNEQYPAGDARCTVNDSSFQLLAPPFMRREASALSSGLWIPNRGLTSQKWIARNAPLLSRIASMRHFSRLSVSARI